ncbi:hypothetical protein F4604DRAFT_2045940 [Suillus subluteus]|nr:hypothetical protein F4604DRAFT_2045940 [Suillus subluteus]
MLLDEMVHDIVTIGILDEAAWCMWFEGRDSDTVGTGRVINLSTITELGSLVECLGLAMPFQYSWTHCGPADMITARVQLQELEYTDVIEAVESGRAWKCEVLGRLGWSPLFPDAKAVAACIYQVDSKSRLGKPERDVEYMIRGITLLEAAREEPEDPIVEQRSVIAHTNIARLRLGLQDHERSLAALGLLLKDAERESQIIHVQAQYGSGSASFGMDDLQAATTSF